MHRVGPGAGGAPCFSVWCARALVMNDCPASLASIRNVGLFMVATQIMVPPSVEASVGLTAHATDIEGQLYADQTPRLWKRLDAAPDLAPHRRTVLSKLLDTSMVPSGFQARPVTVLVWPSSTDSGCHKFSPAWLDQMRTCTGSGTQICTGQLGKVFAVK